MVFLLLKHLLVLSNSIVKPHNVLLGHYYRHMYQMLRLVERANFLDEDENRAPVPPWSMKVVLESDLLEEEMNQ